MRDRPNFQHTLTLPAPAVLHGSCSPLEIHTAYQPNRQDYWSSSAHVHTLFSSNCLLSLWLAAHGAHQIPPVLIITQNSGCFSLCSKSFIWAHSETQAAPTRSSSSVIASLHTRPLQSSHKSNCLSPYSVGLLVKLRSCPCPVLCKRCAHSPLSHVRLTPNLLCVCHQLGCWSLRPVFQFV